MTAPNSAPAPGGPGGPAGRDRVPRVAAVECPDCGGAVELRSFGRAASVVCGSCGSILDPRQHDGVRIIERARAAITIRPMIPLGTRGKWRGVSHEVIGWQRRGIVVEGELYEWDEFLLFNPYRGYRYLTHYRGHWNDVVMLGGMPDESSRARPEARLDGEKFRHFQKAVAITIGVLGEFPWEVRRGDEVNVSDFVAPPRILSKESTPDEITWSLGEYVDGERIWKAFELEGSPPDTEGVYANEPNRRARAARGLVATFLLFTLIALVITIGRNVLARNDLAYMASHATGAPPHVPFVTPNFQLEGGEENVALRLHAPALYNNWLELELSLINTATGRVWDVVGGVSYYEGVSDGERWREGSRRSETIIPNVPGGTYYLRVAPAGGSGRLAYELSVRRDIPMWRYLVVAVALLAVPVVLTGIGAISFESARWSESDYPWSSSGDDE